MSPSSKTVLVIDDVEIVRSATGSILERAGYSVAVAENGEEALKMCRQMVFDIVVTDIVMPEKEGIETIVELRKLSPTTKIIAMSGAESGWLYLESARAFGASQVLHKPFHRKDLLDAVGKLEAEEVSP